MSITAKRILMVRPRGFGFNPETAETNKFQREIALGSEEISRRAAREFDAMAEQLRGLDVDLRVVKDIQGAETPDAVFPNNWFSTHPNGTLCLYPMESRARRLERGAVDSVLEHFDAKKVIDFSGYEKSSRYLEGTGSLVLDHKNRLAFASISSRTNPEVLHDWVNQMDFEEVSFRSYDGSGAEIYHTNVMMCLGDRFAVACVESISDEDERANFVEKLHQTSRSIVEISIEQMNAFAGNMLQIADRNGEKLLVMSKSAEEVLTNEQRSLLAGFNRTAAFDITTIETCGGGSVRCMIAEIF